VGILGLRIYRRSITNGHDVNTICVRGMIRSLAARCLSWLAIVAAFVAVAHANETRSLAGQWRFHLDTPH